MGHQWRRRTAPSRSAHRTGIITLTTSSERAIPLRPRVTQHQHSRPWSPKEAKATPRPRIRVPPPRWINFPIRVPWCLTAASLPPWELEPRRWCRAHQQQPLLSGPGRPRHDRALSKVPCHPPWRRFHSEGAAPGGHSHHASHGCCENITTAPRRRRRRPPTQIAIKLRPQVPPPCNKIWPPA